MTRTLIAGVLVALGAFLGGGDRVEAATADCRVYAASPDFVAGTLQTIPCTPDGLRVVNGSPTTDQEVDLVEVGGVPIALGQTTMSASLPVVFASDQSTLAVGGNLANDSVDAGNPVKVGGRASSGAPTPVASGDRVDAWYNITGAQMVAILTSAAAVGADGANQGLLALPNSSGVASPMGVAGYNFNGTNWDRQRGPAGAVGSSYVENGPYTATRVTADGQIKATAGFVHSVCVTPLTATPTPGLFSLYNSASETGTVVWSAWIFATASQTCFENLDVAFSTGIYVGYDATLTNASVTVTFR